MNEIENLLDLYREACFRRGHAVQDGDSPFDREHSPAETLNSKVYVEEMAAHDEIVALIERLRTERDTLEEMAKRALCPLGDEPDPIGDMLDEVKAERDTLAAEVERLKVLVEAGKVRFPSDEFDNTPW